jgi:uncharacterized membrane protein YhhN
MNTSRLILAASLLAGFSFLLTRFQPAPAAPLLLIWKGAPVALLALYAALGAKRDRRLLLTLVMGLSALGDVLIDALGTVAGGASFLLAHVCAIALYSRNLRHPAPGTAWLIAAAIPATALTVTFLTAPHTLAVLAYVSGVSIMAAFAFMSRFRRDRAALGAGMFLASDLLIVSHLGPGTESLMVSLAIWLLYYLGQVLITLGVMAD